MIRLLHVLLFISLPFIAISQNIKVDDIKNKGKSRLIGQVTIGSKAFDNSAILTLTATDRGLLIPRLTTAERDAISSPATGLMIYNTNTGAFEFFDGSWSAIGGNAAAADSSFVVLQTDTNKAFNNTNIQFADSVFFQNSVQVDSPFTVNLAQSTFKGIDATSTNSALLVTDNVDTKLFEVKNDGYVITNTDGAATFGTRSAGVIAKYSFTAGKTNNATNANAIASSFSLGVDNINSSLFGGALGSTNNVSGQAAIALGQTNIVSGGVAIAVGLSHNLSGAQSFGACNDVTTSAAATRSSGIGWNIDLTASITHAKGTDLAASAIGAQIIGTGQAPGNKLTNANQHSLVIGFRTDVPTFFIGDAGAGSGDLGNVGLFNITSFGTNGKGVLGIGTAQTIPTTSPIDMFQIYSADHSGAGTATIHIRNEEGDIFTYKADGGYVDPTGTSDKSTFATSTVTTEDLAEFVKALYEALKAQGLLKN